MHMYYWKENLTMAALIGISLDDLGIETDSAFTHPETQEEFGYPRAYDFALHLQLHDGSWRQVRDALYPVAVSAFSGREVPLLAFTLHWTEKEDGDSEESIKAALTGLAYDEVVHDAFEDNLTTWAQDLTDSALIRQLAAGSAIRGHKWFLPELSENAYTPLDVLEKLRDRIRTAALLQEIQDTLAAEEALSPELAEMPYLIESVMKYPAISLGLAGYVMECRTSVEVLSRHKQDAWIVRELEVLGLPAQGWDS